MMISLKNCYHLELVPKLTDEMNNSIPLHSSISLLSLKPKPLNCRLKLNSHLNISSTISNSISNAKTTTTGAIIIGGGLAGLAAATKLNSNNIPFLLIESSDGVGGRVRTDVLDGFLLDRGFQIFITAYPHARQLLNYDALDLQKFYSGARIFVNHAEFHTVADPLRHFIDSVNSLTNPIGSVLDKLLIAGKRIQVLSKSDQEILCSNEEVPTLELLKSIGFSDTMISRFFRPFFGGIFFDPQLQTTSKLFDFIFKCLALGDNTLPSKGIGAIPLQLASKLPPDSILLNTLADSIDVPDKKDDLIRVVLENGEVLQSELGVIVAVEQPQLRKLFPHALPSPPLPPRSTVCLYFSAEQDQVPSRDPILYLNGSSKGIINNMFFPTNVAPSYAPPGKALISVSLIGLFEHLSNDDLSAEVLRELSGWFGESMVQTWKHLRTYRIPFAQPNQCPPTDLKKGSRVESGLYLCGDHLTSATFDGALLSGTRAAEALLSDNNAVSTIANPARVAYL